MTVQSVMSGAKPHQNDLLQQVVFFVERALWFVLLDHRGRLVRVPASVCGAYDCSVCYVRSEASPERLAAAGGSHPSVILAL